MSQTVPRTVLVTGITGNLGALAAARMLRRGDTVIALARSRARRGPAGKRTLRSMSALLEQPLTSEMSDRLLILDADITDAALVGALRLPAAVDETWHFASSLKYMPRDCDEIYAANLDGLDHVLALHRRSAAPRARMFYISTAYLAGRSTRHVPERRIAFDPELAFNNDYEKSKLLAENRFLDAVETGDIRGAVFRPSIVVGLRGSGRLVNYNGYYLGLEAWLRLDQYLRGLGRRGERVRVWLDPTNTLNLVPLDVVVDVMLELAAAGPAGGEVFNVVNTRELTLQQAFEILSRFLSLVPVLSGQAAHDGLAKTTYEKLVGYSLTYTAPYLRQKIAFQTDRVREWLGREIAVDMYPDELDALNRRFVGRGDNREVRHAS